MSRHPGCFIRAEIFQGAACRSAKPARGCVSCSEPLRLAQGPGFSLSPEMVIRLEKAFSLPLEMLMRMQCEHDIAQALRRRAEIDVARYVPKADNPQQTSLL